MADLRGNIALIVDGRGALGAGIRQALGDAGATVCMANDEPATEAGVAASCQRVVAAHGRLDLLVNDPCAALANSGRAGSFWEYPAADWQQCSGTAVQLCYAACVHAARVMVGQQRGLIVNLCTPGPGDAHGGMLSRAGTAAVDTMTAEMARQLGQHDVVALALRAAAPLYTGRCIAALAMDPDIAEKAGGSFQVARLAEEYRFSDPAAAG